MPGIFPTGRRDDRSLMSSLIAGRVPSYESHSILTNTHTHIHTAVMNYRALSLKPWLHISSHDTRIHHFAGGIDSSTAIWHKHTRNQALLRNIPSAAVPLNLRRHPLHNTHQYIDAVQAKTSSPALSTKGLLDGSFGLSQICHVLKGN